MKAKHLFFFSFIAIALIAAAGTPTKSQYWIQNGNNDEILISGRNVNMVEGDTLPGGDPWLQRQNEPSIAVSTRNPLHLLAAANDYRTVDVPFTQGPLPGADVEISQAQGDAWIGIFKSFDGGESWTTELLEGYPQDTGSSSPLHGYQAAADPIVRAGTDGLLYVCGMVFQRDPVTKAIGDSAIFVARYIDDNNKEHGNTIRYLGTEIVLLGNPGHKFDKPWLAVDIPRSGGCGNVYVVTADFVSNADQKTHGRILFSKSTDCGQTWSEPLALTDAGKPYQGASIAIDPEDGTIYVAMRRFEIQLGKKHLLPNAIFVTKSTDFGQSFSNKVEVAEMVPFDQVTTPIMFRTNGYPTMTVDDNGVVYVAWSQRQMDGKARIVISTSTSGSTWSAPIPVELAHPSHPEDLLGHQFMPTMTYANGKLMVAWYDSRYDVAWGSGLYNDYIMDEPICEWRHTIDVRVAEAPPGLYPVFNPSIQVSRYIFLVVPDSGVTADTGGWSLVQAQWNPPNFPLFQGGTAPFHGDYIDMSASPMFIWDDVLGRWQFNTEPSDAPVFHVTWTDNRDVTPPWDEPFDWKDYTPTDYDNPEFSTGEIPCGGDWRPGMRNQNVYTSKVSWGLEVGSAGNSKPLNIPRAFIIEVNNTTDEVKSFQLVIGDPGPGGQASFLQFFEDGYSIFELDVTIAPNSSISRPLFFYSSDPSASLRVDVVEIDVPGGTPVLGGLTSFIILNPGDTEAVLEDPDGWEGPPVGEEEIYDPVIELLGVEDWSNAPGHVGELNPSMWSPSMWSPSMWSPSMWSNTIVVTPSMWSPSMWSPSMWSPSMWSPSMWSPSMWSPSMWSPSMWSGAVPDGTNLENARVVDVVWNVKNEGNTTSSYTFKTFAKEALPEGLYVQLVVYKTTYMSVTNGEDCVIRDAPQTDLLANITNPSMWSPSMWSPSMWSTNVFNAAIENATFSVPPGEEVSVLLRLIEENVLETKIMQNGEVFDLLAFANEIGGGVTAQQVNTSDAEAGIRIPRAAATKLLLGTAALPDGSVGVEYTGYVDAVGGDSGNYTYLLNSGELPPGLDLSTGYSASYPYPRGIISGEPTTAGTYYFVVQVDDGTGQTDNQAYKITIHDGVVPDTPTITTPSPLPNAIHGVYYGVGLEASGGQLPYIWTIEPGSSLPDDLSLDQGGVITGKPEAPVGTYTFTVMVSDQQGDYDTKEFSLEILPFTGADITISGMVYDSGGLALNGVVMRGLPNTPITGAGDWADGYYEDTVPQGWEGTARPFKIGYSFDPVQRPYTSTDTVVDIPDQDYNEYIESLEEWVARYDGIGEHELVLDMTSDHLGNVYVTGYSTETGTWLDITTIKYDSSGNQLWAAHYNGSGNRRDEGGAIAVDPLGNVYVTGRTENSETYKDWDFVTVKYDMYGGQLWAAQYDGPGLYDVATAIAVDSSGNVYVTGRSDGDPSAVENLDYTTIKYDSSGNQLWAARYNGPGDDEEWPRAIAVDSSGNVYVTGWSDGDPSAAENFDYATVKYDSSGNQLWVSRYDGGVGHDRASDIAIDSTGIYVTGSSGVNEATIKYNKNTGGTLWTSFTDAGSAIALDSAGNVYVTGSKGGSTSFDYVTVMLDDSGTIKWDARYDGLGSDADLAHDIVVDSLGNVYVTGASKGAGADYDYATIRYNNAGVVDWIERYDGLGHDSDMAKAIVLDSSGNVFVTGDSIGSGTDDDYVTIKYGQSFPSTLIITTEELGQGHVGIDYAAAVWAFGGSGSRTWSLAGGALPPDLSLNSSTGVISGTPTTPGTYNFTVQVVDGALNHTKPLSITIDTTVGPAFQLAYSQQPNTTTAGATISPPVTVEIQDEWGNLITTATDDVTLSLSANPSGGTLDGTLTKPAVDGIATFDDLSIDTVGTGYQLRAESGSLTEVDSDLFDIDPGSANQLAFSQQPSSTTAGVIMSPPVTVEIQDALGNLVPTATDDVTITLSANPSGGTLSGTLTRPAVGGTATFDNLSIDMAGIGYQMSAVSGGLTIAYSNSFDITPGAATQVLVETAPDGSGTVVPAQTVPSGSSITVYAISRDLYGNYIENCPADGWLLVNKTGGVLDGDLAGYVTNAIFTGNLAGTAKIRATKGGLTSVDSGTITVTGGGALATKIELTGPAKVGGGFISEAFTITAQDDIGTPVPVAQDTVFDLSSNSGGISTFYSSLDLTVPTLQATIPSGQTSVSFYYMDQALGNPTVTATWASGGSDLGSNYHQINVWAVVGQIAFSSDRDGNNEIYFMHSDGSGVTRLTDNSASDGEPMWSTDGSKIVFTSARDSNNEIYVMNADGSHETRLTDHTAVDQHPCWSPDGSKITFTSTRNDGNYEIYAMDSDGSNVTRLTNDPGEDYRTCWSPDGSKIAFESNRDGDDEIYTMDANGSNVTNLTNNDIRDVMPCWSPDGSKIAFVSVRATGYEICVMDADGSNVTCLTDSPEHDWDPCWSPDSSKIIFHSLRTGDWEIYVMNPDGTGQTNITNNNLARDLSPSWGGAKIAYYSNRDGNPEIYLMNIDGSGQTRLTTDTGFDQNPSWSPDGTRIAFENSWGTGFSEISIMNSNGLNMTRLTNNTLLDMVPSWSPDGNKIAFTRSPSSSDLNEIYVMNSDGSNVTRLTDNSSYEGSTCWSPDGTKIVFESERDSIFAEIYVMNSDGSNVTRLTDNSATDGYACWSPDGTKIVFVSNRDGNAEIYVMNANGSEQTRLTTNGWTDRMPCWSSCGSKIAFSSNRDGNFQIYIMNVDGSGQTRLTNNSAADRKPSWRRK